MRFVLLLCGPQNTPTREKPNRTQSELKWDQQKTELGNDRPHAPIQVGSVTNYFQHRFPALGKHIFLAPLQHIPPRYRGICADLCGVAQHILRASSINTRRLHARVVATYLLPTKSKVLSSVFLLSWRARKAALAAAKMPIGICTEYEACIILWHMRAHTSVARLFVRRLLPAKRSLHEMNNPACPHIALRRLCS